MKDQHTDDSLDAAIDSLLSIKPLKAADKLCEDVIATAKATPEARDSRQSYPFPSSPLFYALSLAAALALAVIIWPAMQTPENEASLSYDEAQEILRMEASLQALLPLQEEENFTTNGLLVTFETATYTL